MTVDYSDGSRQTQNDYPTIEDKLDKAIRVARAALEEYQNPAVLWTGDRDSTLAIYVVREVAARHGFETPPAVFLDHAPHVADRERFVDRWAGRWEVDVVAARNGDAVPAGDGQEASAVVADRDERGSYHRTDADERDEGTFPSLPDVGDAPLQTTALKDALVRYDIDGIVSGIRWDQRESATDETFFSPRHQSTAYPPHDRVQPLLQFTDADAWEATWEFLVPNAVDGYPDQGYVPSSVDGLPGGIEVEDVPVHPKYFDGHRPLGNERGSARAAWLRTLDATTERTERVGERKALIERLRDSGYL